MLRRGMRQHRLLVVLTCLTGVLVICIIVATAFGAVAISPLSIVRMSLNRVAFVHLAPTWQNTDETILFQVRLPRVLAGALVGAALATAGVLFQGLLRNPMADPYIIGTSAGAAFGATLAMVLPLGVVIYGFSLVPIAAFCGALVAVLVVYNLARVGPRTPVVSMLLAGFAVSSLLAAVMTLVMTLSDRLQLNIRQVFSFLMGGISVDSWMQIVVVTPIVLAGVLLARFFAFHLNAFALGEEGAAYLGINVEREKVLILALGSLLTAAAVSLSGLVGFVGLVVPHAMRLALGPDHRLLLPASALAGGSFLIIADLLARTLVAPTELPVGTLTALIGAPFFLFLLRRARKEYAF